MKFYLKVHETSGDRMVAVCDADILGKTINHNGVNIRIKESFYGDDEYELDEALYEIKRGTSINAFGGNICRELIKHNLVHPATVMWMEHDNQQVGHVIIVR